MNYTKEQVKEIIEYVKYDTTSKIIDFLLDLTPKPILTNKEENVNKENNTYYSQQTKPITSISGELSNATNDKEQSSTRDKTADIHSSEQDTSNKTQTLLDSPVHYCDTCGFTDEICVCEANRGLKK